MCLKKDCIDHHAHASEHRAQHSMAQSVSRTELTSNKRVSQTGSDLVMQKWLTNEKIAEGKVLTLGAKISEFWNKIQLLEDGKDKIICLLWQGDMLRIST